MDSSFPPTCTIKSNSIFLAVLSSDQSNVRRDGKEEYLEEVGWTDKSFHQKRRGTRIVQSKEHLHSVHPLEFHPHPPPQFRSNACKNQSAMLSHPSIPSSDSRLNYSSLPRNAHSQVRQVCMYGGSIPSVTSEFQPHPPLQPRNFFNQIRQCHSSAEYPTIPLEGQASSPSQCARNMPNFSKAQPLFALEGCHPDRCVEPRGMCKSTGCHSFKNAGSSSPVLSGIAPHVSRDYLMPGQPCIPLSPVGKTFHFKTHMYTSHHSNRVHPLDISQTQDVIQNTSFADLNNEGPSVSGQQPFFPAGVRLPANYQWAIIDDSGSVTPLPPGSFPAATKKDSEESSAKSPNSPEGSFSSFPPLPCPGTPSVLLPSIKGVEEPPKLQTESLNANAPPKHKQRCLGVESEEDRPVEPVFEHLPTNVQWKKKRGKGAIMDSKLSSCKEALMDSRQSSFKGASMDNNQSSYKGRAGMDSNQFNSKPTVSDSDDSFFKDSPRARKPALSLSDIPDEKTEILSNEQHGSGSLTNGEKKQRNFKLPMGWCSNSKNWFKSPFKKEKKNHQKTTTFPPREVHLPPLLTIDEFSSLNISDEKTSGSSETEKDNVRDNKKKSVYTLGEFLKLCDDWE